MKKNSDLNGVVQRAAEKEKCGGVLEALFAHQNEGVLQRGFLPLFLRKVLTEEIHHALQADRFK